MVGDMSAGSAALGVGCEVGDTNALHTLTGFGQGEKLNQLHE